MKYFWSIVNQSMYDVLKWSGQGTLCCWLRVHIRRLQVMGSVCSIIGLVALDATARRPEPKKGAGGGAEVKPRCEDARRASRDRGHESVMQSWRSSVFSARVTVRTQATAQNQHRSINR